MKQKFKPIEPRKVWFVDMPSFSSWRRYFSGEAFGYRARIFPSRKLALQAWPDEKPIPVLITPISPKKKAKKIGMARTTGAGLKELWGKT